MDYSVQETHTDKFHICQICQHPPAERSDAAVELRTKLTITHKELLRKLNRPNIITGLPSKQKAQPRGLQESGKSTGTNEKKTKRFRLWPFQIGFEEVQPFP